MTIDTSILSAEDPAALSRAHKLITQGQLMILPTETLFGLTCDATNLGALRSVFELKRREMIKPAAIYVSDVASIGKYAVIEHDYAHRIISEHLPGPLTVVLQSRRPDWPGVVSATGKIGIRVSTEPFVNELVRLVDKPLCATSANISGRPNIEDINALKERFANQVGLIVFRTKTVRSAPSTVIDLSGPRPEILRQGAINLDERLAAILREK